MYQNFVTDLIKTPMTSTASTTVAVKWICGADDCLSIAGSFTNNAFTAAAFEIDPIKDTCLSFKLACVGVPKSMWAFVRLLSSDTPISTGNVILPATLSATLSPTIANCGATTNDGCLIYDERVLIPRQLDAYDGKHYYAVLVFNKGADLNAYLHISGRAHYTDKTVYQPSK